MAPQQPTTENRALRPRASLIPIGEAAPDFHAPADDGAMLHLSELLGRKAVILVFYPADDTSVCTAQLCALRDRWPDLQEQEIAVLGINPAGREKHSRFAAKHGFPFPLVADAGGRIAAAYGCRMLFGIVRRTVYAIDRQGRIAYARRGNPAPEEALAALRNRDM